MLNAESKRISGAGIYEKVYLPRSCNAKEKEKEKEKVKYMVWTNEMDSCLAKILVAQIKKGNKKNGTFKHVAYVAALSYMNEKFSLDFTKDHIKNRLKTWKKQFRILKELLLHKGFEWDDSQHMVVADNSVLNDYIKAHPDAKQFRAKVMEIYDELCVIIGNDPQIAGCFDRNTVFEMDNIDNKDDMASGKALDFQKDEKQSIQLTWTEEMDCSLCEILVEEMRKGLKIDNILQCEGCETVISALKEKFGPELTKAHIQRRLGTWKKQYGTMRKLLSHAGFRWDGAQRKILANDFLWNDYVKRNPDSKQLQGRIMHNYNELCIIFGGDDLPESSPRDGSSDFNFVAESCSVDAEDIFHNQSDNGKEKGKYIFWTGEMDRCLIKMLLEQVLLGNKLEKSFKAAAYTAALAVLNKKFALDLSKDNIRNRLKTWRKQYELVKELLSHSGFEWDEKQKMIVASDSKWNEFIEKNAEVKNLRTKSIENFNELRIIIGNEQASGNWSGTSAGILDRLQDNEDRAETPLHFSVDNETSHDAAADGIQESSQQTRSRPSLSHLEQPYKRSRGDDVVVDLISAIATNVGRIADALTKNNDSVCLDGVFEMVQKTPGFDDDLIIDACEYLSSEENRARMFMKLDERLRKMWLLKRLRGQGS